MDDREFVAKSDACLGRVAKWLEDFDPDDVDYATADGSVTLEFPDGAKFILSRQSATKQVWLAAGSRGYHYNYDTARDTWVDDKTATNYIGGLRKRSARNRSSGGVRVALQAGFA